MAILAKLAASLQGFWWGLDDRERIMVAAGALYLVLTALAVAGAREKGKDRERFADAVAARVARTLEARHG